MDKEKFEKIINTLQQYIVLDNVINELENIQAYKKHKELLNDKISEIEKVVYSLEQLERELYYDYLENETEKE